MATAIKWFGHSTFQVQTPGGKTILIDPWVQGNPACPESEKHLSKVDLMLITHGHSDHMGDAVSVARQHQPVIACIYEIYLYLSKQGIQNFQPMNKGGTIHWEGISVTMVNAFHSSGIDVEGEVITGGEPAGFVVTLEDGFTFYHAGDTCVFGDMRIIGELYRPRLAMLPIGDRFTMSPREAAYAIRLLNVQKVIPMHWGTFPLLTGTPDQLREFTRDMEGLEVLAIRPGEQIALVG